MLFLSPELGNAMELGGENKEIEYIESVQRKLIEFDSSYNYTTDLHAILALQGVDVEVVAILFAPSIKKNPNSFIYDSINLIDDGLLGIESIKFIDGHNVSPEFTRLFMAVEEEAFRQVNFGMLLRNRINFDRVRDTNKVQKLKTRLQAVSEAMSYITK